MESSWYEAEKLLPASTSKVRVSFQVHGLGGPWPIYKVERKKHHRWVMAGKDHELEIICFRSLDHAEAVDAVFELKGPMHACYVSRAWNVASTSKKRAVWEYWKDEKSRPLPEPPPSTLQVADGAAPQTTSADGSQVHFICSMKRMCAAAKELLDVHRRTLDGLRSLDASLTGQWVGANVGTTASAGLGIASAVLLFVAPPVGLGIGIGSAVTGGLTFAGDSVADVAFQGELKRQLFIDSRETFMVAELLRQWMQSQEALGAASLESKLDDEVEPDRLETEGAGSAIDTGLYAGTALQVTGNQATSLARTVANLGSAATIATQVFGVAGALITTGLAVRGWSQTKNNQVTVRSKIRELLLRILQIQHLIAAVDRLECPICFESVTLADEVRHCCDAHHCFHASCLEERRKALGIEGIDSCPVCSGSMDMEDECKVESADRFRVSFASPD